MRTNLASVVLIYDFEVSSEFGLKRANSPRHKFDPTVLITVRPDRPRHNCVRSSSSSPLGGELHMFGGLHVTQSLAKSCRTRPRSPLDVEKMRAMAVGKPDEQLTVSKRWLRRVLAELDASGDTFRSPIITLAHAGGHD